MLPGSPQPLWHDYFSPRYGQKLVFLVKWPNMVITPPPPKKEKKRKHFLFITTVLPKRFEQALNHYHMIISDQDMAENVFQRHWDFWKFGPRPQKWKKIFLFFFVHLLHCSHFSHFKKKFLIFFNFFFHFLVHF